MMNNAWKINDGDRSYGKGWANKDESPSKNPGQAYGAKASAGTAAGGRTGGAGAGASNTQTFSRP